MNLFAWKTRTYQIESMTIGCSISDESVQCSVSDVSRSELTCTIPTSRIQKNLVEMLNSVVAIRLSNVVLEGTLNWYTIEESTYRIGISIARKDRGSWRKILAERSSSLLHASARPASI